MEEEEKKMMRRWSRRRRRSRRRRSRRRRSRRRGKKGEEEEENQLHIKRKFLIMVYSSCYMELELRVRPVYILLQNVFGNFQRFFDQD